MLNSSTLTTGSLTGRSSVKQDFGLYLRQTEPSYFWILNGFKHHAGHTLGACAEFTVFWFFLFWVLSANWAQLIHAIWRQVTLFSIQATERNWRTLCVQCDSRFRKCNFALCFKNHGDAKLAFQKSLKICIRTWFDFSESLSWINPFISRWQKLKAPNFIEISE